MALDGIVFDLDGTLVDTNGVHVEAFRKAFAKHGYTVSPDRIFIEIGKGGDKLVPHVIGKEANEKDGDAIRAAQPEEFGKIANKQGLKVFPGARELIAELKRRGLRTVIATSSEDRQLARIEEGSGVRWRELVDEVVVSSDVERSKPDPDVVSAAVTKLRMSPAQCAMIGDTPYDGTSSKHAGVVCLGVTSGGHSERSLRESGCRAVYRDVAEILDKLDDALQTASPGSAHLTQDVLESLVRKAILAAEEGMHHGEVPIGCVLARGDGTVIASGYNELNKSKNPTAHAEMVTFARVAGKVEPEARDLVLVSTLEPCVMCLGAAMESAVDTIIYGLKAPADSGTGRVSPPASPESQMPRIVGDVLAKESRDLFVRWLNAPADRNPQQVRFVRQLLDLTA